jgi:alpha-mannosidase
MTLNPEWRNKIEQWRDAIGRMIFEPVAPVAFLGFRTRQQLSVDEALRKPMTPMPAGMPWGAKWEYAWLRASLVTPPNAVGRRLMLRLGPPGAFSHPPAGEGRFIVDGREAGGYDYHHSQVTLARRAEAGRTYDVLIELYAGHGPTPCGNGPVLDGEPAVPESPETQRVIPPAYLGLWHEEVYQTWLDLETLLEVRDHLDAHSLRVANIDEGLKAFCTAFDPEAPAAERLNTLADARRRHLTPLLRCRNGSTAPRFFCFGHSHIDVAWLWPLAETERKVARTFATQLALMEEYPEFRFLQSQPVLYEMVQRLYPELFERIREAVRKGSWIAEGGMWVECDTNIAGGEAMIRQLLYGLAWFREQFGVECRMLWLPDVFGYSGALPQILKGVGLEYFSTQKIFWNYNGEAAIPFQNFWWEGIDGTRLLTHLHHDYNSATNPATLIRRWNDRVQKEGMDSRLIPFGHGDGGGGPTRDHLEFLRRQKDLEGAPRCRIASPLDFFRALERQARRQELPVFVGELYYQAHRGTYTSQARTKRGNRRGEFALRELELWGVLARRAGWNYPRAAVDGLWKLLLLNQFHDILPGSSIRRVYEEAEAAHEKLLREAARWTDQAREALLRPDAQAATVFNSLGWPRSVLVPLPRGWKGAADDHGPLPVQSFGSNVLAETTLPPCGWRTLRRSETASPAADRSGAGARAKVRTLENECLTATFNERGEIISLLDRETGGEWAAGPMNRFRLFRDVPRAHDAWDIDSNYEQFEETLSGEARVEALASGPLVAILRVTRSLGRSTLTQEVWLRRNQRRLDFRTVVDWREKHRLLKVAFPTPIRSMEALHEIQFGHIARPTHRSLPFDAERFETAQHKWTAIREENRGAALLNDCKYGGNVIGGTLQLTLLRAPLAPDPQADQGLHEFTYAFTFWNGPFMESNLVRDAYDLNVPVALREGCAGEGSAFTLEGHPAVIETVKPAEDGSEACIVRLYEPWRATGESRLKVDRPLRAAWFTDLRERPLRRASLTREGIVIPLRPFQIVTLRLEWAGASPQSKGVPHEH